MKAIDQVSPQADPRSARELQLGFRAHQAGQLRQARLHYEIALVHEPENTDCLYLLGLACLDDRQPELATRLLDRCVGHEPENGKFQNALGNALQAQKRNDEAALAYRRGIRGQPPCLEAFCNLGSILRRQGKVDEAIDLYHQALALKPDFVEVLCNLGTALKARNEVDEAIAVFRQALAFRPDLAEAHFNEGLALLLAGNLRQGWPKHEYRWLTEQRRSQRDFAAPLWLGGQPLQGRSILLHAEQGLGDTLQFVRYVPLVASLGATVYLEVQPALKSLLSVIPQVKALYAKSDLLPPFDYHCPLLSLSLAFATDLESIPSTVPYLQAPPEKVRLWHERLESHTRPRIGLVWFGNRQHRNDHNRSIPPVAMAEFLRTSPHRFFCLQKEIRESGDAALAALPNVTNLSADLGDFRDTAAIIANLDLVITVDTSIAHLAGALGKPTWVLLPYAPDWRWLLDRSDSPWYPAARLFRQPQPMDWQSVLCAVRAELDRTWNPLLT